MLTPDELFDLLSDKTRLRCLMLLLNVDELCVCELTTALQLSQPKISRHLASLRKLGIVIDERRGLWIYYRVNPNLSTWAKDILNATSKIISEQEPYQSDRENRRRLSNKNICLSQACVH